MDTTPEMTRLHRLTQEESDLIHEYRVLGDDFRLAIRTITTNMVLDKSTKATPTNSNVVKFPG